MTDDPISRIEAALEAGPTPGPWRHEAWGSRILDSGVGSSQLLIATVAANTFRDQGRHNAEYIAACSPDVIRALLDRLNDLELNGSQAVRWAPSSAHWSAELRRLFGGDSRDGIGALEQRLRHAEDERDQLRDILGELIGWNSHAPAELVQRAKRILGDDA